MNTLITKFCLTIQPQQQFMAIHAILLKRQVDEMLVERISIC